MSNSPPKKKYDPIVAEPAPGPPVPLHPASSIDKGVKATTNPTRALQHVSDLPLLADCDP
jgi:hypothetical protein